MRSHCCPLILVVPNPKHAVCADLSAIPLKVAAVDVAAAVLVFEVDVDIEAVVVEKQMLSDRGVRSRLAGMDCPKPTKAARMKVRADLARCMRSD